MLREAGTRSLRDWRFDILFSIRARAIGWKLSTVMTLVIATVSVAIATSFEITSRSITEGLDRAASAAQGRAEVEITAGDVGIARNWLDQVRALKGVASAAPTIDRTVKPLIRGGYGDQVHLLGIDLSYDRDPRDFLILRNGYLQRDLARFRKTPGVIAIPSRLAKRLGVSEGGSIRVRDVDRDLVLSVDGTLSGELATAWDGNVAVMDLEALRRVFSVETFTRIDITLEPPPRIEEFISSLQAQLRSSGTIRPARSPSRFLEGIFGVARAGVWAIVVVGIVISLMVSSFISSKMVERRTEEFRILRAVGMSQRRLMWLIVLEALLVAVLASGCGLAVATITSKAFVGGFSNASRFVDGTIVQPLSATWLTAVIAIVAAGTIVVVSSIEPAFRAAKQAELGSSACVSRAVPLRRLAPWVVRVSAILGTGLLVTTSGPWLLGYEIVQVLVVIVGGVMSVGAASYWLLGEKSRWMTAALERAVLPVSQVVAGSLRESPVELAAIVTTWATAVGAIAAIVGTVQGVIGKVEEVNFNWAGGTPIVGTAEDPERAPSIRRAAADPAVVERIESSPGVESVAVSRVRRIVFEGEDVIVYSVPTRIQVAHGGLLTISEDPGGSIEALERGECLISEVLRNRHSIEIGREVELLVSHGLVRCRVGGLGVSARGGLGTIHVDESVFRRWFGEVGPDLVYVWSSESTDIMLPALVKKASPERLFFISAAQREGILNRILRPWIGFIVLPILGFIGIGTLGLIVVATGMSSEERAVQIASQRVFGGTVRSVVATHVAKCFVVGLLGSAAGFALGVTWAHTFARAVRGIAGWEVPWPVDTGAIAVVCGVAFVLSMSMALLAAWSFATSRAERA